MTGKSGTIFISHASEDHAAAESIVDALETRGIACWVAPRDIPAGSTWGGEIVEAIASSSALVVLLSRHSNDSKQVLREVELADADDTPVVPYRLANVDPSADLAYFLRARHWLDGFGSSRQENLHRLIETAATSAQVEVSPVEETSDEDDLVVDMDSWQARPEGGRLRKWLRNLTEDPSE